VIVEQARAEHAHFVRAGAHDLFAVVTEPSAAPLDVGVLILAGGRYGNTGGRNGVAGRLAASLSARGYHVMRIDYHGIGDSTGRIEEFVLHEPFVDDASAALGVLRAYGVDRVAVLGDCFGARTALATCTGPGGVDALVLVSLPWRDLARSDRKAHIVSSELTVTDYVRRGMTAGAVRKLATVEGRRQAFGLVRAKATQLRRRVDDRMAGIDVEPWVSRRVLEQLATVRDRRTPALLLYGRGPAEDYTHDFEAIRMMPAVAWLRGHDRIETRILDQPIAGYRNVVSQDEVVRAAPEWLDGVFVDGTH